ncbi:MAG: hypothetical protein WC408_01075, partial [Candidatus Micrarchaeia archaeon]
FDYPQHEAVGIKCPLQYSFENTGYCFVESADTTIITDSEGDYYSSPTTLSKLPSNPTMTVLSEGSSFDSVDEEYNDAETFKKLDEISEKTGGMLQMGEYSTWEGLVKKYGLNIQGS